MTLIVTDTKFLVRLVFHTFLVIMLLFVLLHRLALLYNIEQFVIILIYFVCSNWAVVPLSPFHKTIMS